MRKITIAATPADLPATEDLGDRVDLGRPSNSGVCHRMSRLHKKNGVLELTSALVESQPSFSDFRLRWPGLFRK
jgi:hypothetical protein